MEPNRKRRGWKLFDSEGLENGQGQNRTADTRIFSPLTVPRLYDTICRYLYLFKRLTPVCSPSFSRFEHIAANSSGKVVAKLAVSVVYSEIPAATPTRSRWYLVV